VSDSKLKQPAKAETKKMFQKRVKDWNITNDDDDQANDDTRVEVKQGKVQMNFEYDDIDDSDTEDVFEL
jgi:hypothetical protein